MAPRQGHTQVWTLCEHKNILISFVCAETHRFHFRKRKFHVSHPNPKAQSRCFDRRIWRQNTSEPKNKHFIYPNWDQKCIFRFETPSYMMVNDDFRKLNFHVNPLIAGLKPYAWKLAHMAPGSHESIPWVPNLIPEMNSAYPETPISYFRKRNLHV